MINGAIMNIKKLSLAAAVSALTFTTASNAVLGPIPIYLNTEYRTDTPVIGSISSTITLTSSDIEKSGANSFLELLATIPSAGLVNPQGNIPAVFLRGNEARHTLVLVDGVSINDISSTDGAVGYALKSVSLNDIEKIEIIKGSASVLYGSGAIGGVISITTKKGAHGENVSLSITAGTHRSRNYSFIASAGDNDNFVRLSSNRYLTNGISAKTTNTERDGITDQTTNLKVGINTNNTKIIFDVSSSKNDTEYDGCYGSDANNCLANKTTLKKGVSFDKDIYTTWNTKLYYNIVDQTRQNIDNGTADVYGKTFKKTDITLLNTVNLNNFLLNIGLSKIDDKDITANKTLSSNDVYFNFQKNINEIDLNTGLRFINHSDFGNETIYNLGVAKNINNDTRLTGTYGTAFYAPAIYQINYGATSSLKPETSKNIEIGIEKQHDWGDSNIKFYKNEVRNLIDYNWASCSTGDLDYSNWPTAGCTDGGVYTPDFYSNKSKLNIKGIELSLNTSIKGYDISAGHNYVDSKLDGSSTQQKRRPKNTTNLTINKKYGEFTSNVQVIKKSSSIDTTTLPGYILVNLSTVYNYNTDTKVSLKINNALDKDYTVVNDYNQLGRTINLGVIYKF
jgi:vitamin B12 transporter